MADAAKGIDCGMTAVMNLDRDALAKCCEEASALGVVQICNYNCPGQLVIGGEKAAVEKAAELAKAAGARRCIPLKVSGPFHTKLMHPAGDALAKRFESEHFGEMETPVLFNCLGHEKADSDSIPALLEKQVQSSVPTIPIIFNESSAAADAIAIPETVFTTSIFSANSMDTIASARIL